MVDNGLCPLKSGPTGLSVLVCFHDAVSSKLMSVERGAGDLHTQTRGVARNLAMGGQKF